MSVQRSLRPSGLNLPRSVLYWSFLMLTPLTTHASDIVCFGQDDRSGSSGAVRVDNVGLVHTEQVLPVDENGHLKGETVTEQFLTIFSRLDAAGRQSGSGMDRCVKLNVYVRDNADAEIIRTVLAERFKGTRMPAVCYVTTNLSLSDARVAADAVIAASGQLNGSAKRFIAKGPVAAFSVLPAGARAYISGQAEQGDIILATRKTLESLRMSLEFMHADLSHVIQVKSFLTRASDVPAVEREIRLFFGNQIAPPLVFVEWISGATTPIEIELIAAITSETLPADVPPVEYLTPPGMTSPPIYSRITRVAAPQTIYVSGLYGSSNNPEQQVKDVFEQLTQLLLPAGGDLRHLVKATYYVSDEHVSTQLNALRPNYYDPKRPPAASKAMVTGVGRNDRTLTMDMIAVPH